MVPCMTPHAYLSCRARRPAAGAMPYWKLRTLKRQLARKQAAKADLLPARTAAEAGRSRGPAKAPKPSAGLQAGPPARDVRHRPDTKRYWPARACSRGHWATRYVSSNACSVCAREADYGLRADAA